MTSRSPAIFYYVAIRPRDLVPSKTPLQTLAKRISLYGKVLDMGIGGSGDPTTLWFEVSSFFSEDSMRQALSICVADPDKIRVRAIQKGEGKLMSRQLGLFRHVTS